MYNLGMNKIYDAHKRWLQNQQNYWEKITGAFAAGTYSDEKGVSPCVDFTGDGGAFSITADGLREKLLDTAAAIVGRTEGVIVEIVCDDAHFFLDRSKSAGANAAA